MDNENEVWMPIPDYEGLYEVSNLGNVRSLDREVAGKAGSVRILKGKVLKPAMTRDDYLQVTICKEGKTRIFSIHRLVYTAFNGSIPEGYEVNHLDEDKTNNKLENLNLMTRKENINFGTRNKRAGKANTNHPSMSKPVVALNEDGEIVLEFPSAMDAQRQGFDHRNISACCRGKQRAHRGYRWRFKEELENA